MIAFFKGRAVSQVDEFLCEGEKYSVKDLCSIIREFKVEPISKNKKKKAKKK